jgi:hypothetical protein
MLPFSLSKRHLSPRGINLYTQDIWQILQPQVYVHVVGILELLVFFYEL